MLVYGKNVATEILNSEKIINKVYLLDSFTDYKIINNLKQQNLDFEKIEKEKMDKMVDGLHQGIVLEIDDFKLTDIEEIYNDESSNFIVMLDHLEDPHNFGAIIRTCECAGVDYIIIPNKRSVQVNSTVMKTSAGALSKVKIASVTNLNNTIKKLKDKGFWSVGADMVGTDYREIGFDFKTLLIIGSEGKGIKYAVKENCDYIASLPMKGEINSLNASVAAALLIYEVIRKK